MEFNKLKLSPPILQAIDDLGFKKPSDIQNKAIPLLVKSKSDFVGLAQTGSGKTAAFVIPLLQKVEPNNKIQAVVLTPSRELAKQVENEIKLLGKYLNIKSTAIYGGVSYDKQFLNIKKDKPEIIVGTPGRIIDLLERKTLNFKDVNMCILDEADEMLRMGFIDEVYKIIGNLNSERRIWMFSATMPKEISKLISTQFENPHVVEAERQNNIGPDIKQVYYVADRRRRHEVIYRILQVEENYHTIVFCRTRLETRELSDKLLDKGLKVDSLSGEMSQNLRESAMNKFKSHKTNILICTDVAARGIDVKDVTHVINYGLPQDNETYVHRIGRTARAGKSGTAITIIPPEDIRFLEKMVHLTGNDIEPMDIPDAQLLKERIIVNSLDKINKISAAVTEKGNEYSIDPSFKVFKKNFKDLSKEDLEKVMFTYIYNKDFRHIDELGDLAPRKRRSNAGSGSSSGSSSRQARRSRSFHNNKIDQSKNNRRRSPQRRRSNKAQRAL